MNDLRARIAAIVERDRARLERGRERGATAPTETLSTRRGPPGLATGAPSRGGPRSAPLANPGQFSVRDQRIAFAALGLELVGRSAIGPVRCAHLGVKWRS